MPENTAPNQNVFQWKYPPETVLYGWLCMVVCMGNLAFQIRPCRLCKFIIGYQCVMILHYPFRMSNPQTLKHLSPPLAYFVTPAHSHVVEVSNNRSQARTACNRLEGTVQLPTRFLIVFDHEFVLPRFDQRKVPLQHCPQFREQGNKPLPMPFVVLCFG